MYIQEVVLDGFKSYAHRTVIEGFDPHFNAITGLNGSGKSNILDAICFVLGITNLSQVRAGNLSELVYKQGQAGVTKATVTLVFNNEDKAESPVGYEQYHEVTVTRQVLLGGKSKYLINGRNAPAGQVQNLFHSVQLNVNNPHFLIMQGRITKVLNMKPHEILGMVEEAAGTRMYETKRVAALKTIDKKQTKLDELNAILAEEITPTLERLRGEKQTYLQWTKNNADMERMERFVVASEYTQAVKALNADGTQQMETQMADLQTKAQQYRDQIAEHDRAIESSNSKLKGEFEDRYNAVKKREQELSNELVRVTSAWKYGQEAVKKAEADVAAAHTLVAETKESVTAKQAEIEQESSSLEEIRAAAQQAEQRVQQLSLDYQNMSAGLSLSQGDEGRTLPEQITQAHGDSKTAEARVHQAQLKIDHLSKQLKSVEREISKMDKSAESMSLKRDKAVKNVDELQKKLQELNFSEAEYASFDQTKNQLESRVAELEQVVERLTVQLEARLGFKYSDPVRGFDRSKVKGLVAKLITVKDPKYSTALEVTAGGKLYQVVVDEAITGKALLERGKLERRVTIIPLDKIQSRRVGHSACEQSKSIADSMDATASPAIELVGFDEEVRSAVEYVFGSTIVVDGMKAANQICDATKTRTVTLDGDVFDPSGTISGGSKNNLGTTLSNLAELAVASKELAVKSKNLKQLVDKAASMKASMEKFEKLTAKLELAQAELQAAEKHLSQTSFGMHLESRDTMLRELEEAKEECVQMEKEQKSKWQLYELLKEKEVELTQQREDRLEALDQAVRDAKANRDSKGRVALEADARAQTLLLELESLQEEVAAANDAVRAAEKALLVAVNEESELQIKVGSVQAAYEEARQELDSFEKKMISYSSEIVDLKRKRSDLAKAAETATLEAKKMSVLMTRLGKERAAAEKAVASMLKKYAWIESDANAFGVAGGDYDFEKTDPNATTRQLHELKSEQDALAKKINKKVMGMIEKAEGEYQELLRKRKVVENDKKKIQNVIKELDIKKKSELQRTWVKVNRDFGSIFTTLLPGAAAKLEPPVGMEAWEGLEVKVAFGDPAPMYILDEVDAALDLSHTQNIGNMLKTHFSQSQFIVVSLKEGMFNNANVIFRTKFVDGVSTVTRTIGIGTSRARALAAAERNSSESDQQKGSSGGGATGAAGKENAAYL